MDILGIGECMIELDPVDGSLATASQFAKQVGGDVYNTLVACSRLGVKTGFLTQIAADGFGATLFNHFTENGIDTRWVQTLHEGKNGLYFASVTSQGHHEFVYYRERSAASKMHPELLKDELFDNTRLVYASGVTQAISTSARRTVLQAFQKAKQQGCTVAYDPNFRLPLWYRTSDALEAVIEVLPYVDIFLPTLEDLKALFGFSDIAHILDYFVLRGVQVVALKQGEHGVSLGMKHHQLHVQSYPPTRVVDSIGAGDAFNGGFLSGIIQQRSLVDAARIGTLVASCSLASRGPIQGLPTMSFVEQRLTESGFSASV